MSDPINPFSITSPGFYGLNLQDSPVGLDPRYALQATNCIIDQEGRLAARKGLIRTSTNIVESGDPVEALAEIISATGSSTLVCAAGDGLYKLSGTSLAELTYGGGGTAPTIPDAQWQIVSFNGVALFFQRGVTPLVYDPTISTTAYRRISEHASYVATAPLANCGLAAYGRIWAASTDTERTKIYWTDTLTYMVWNTGTAGSLDLKGVWPLGGDEIVGLAAHNGFLFIFGKTQTLIYSGAEDPQTMKLHDAIANVGCIARDTIQNTGGDIVFLSNYGVSAISRVIQEKSAPERSLSRNIDASLVAYIAADTNIDKAKAVYSTRDKMYLLNVYDDAITYCFSLRDMLPTGAARVTLWNSLDPKSFCCTNTGKLYFGQAGYIGQYGGYTDSGSAYNMTYFSTWIDFGNPVQQSILKKIIATLTGVIRQTVAIKWGVDYSSASKSITVNTSNFSIPSEYNIDEYGEGEYTGGLTTARLQVNAGGVGRVIQVGVDVQVNGYPISIQQLDIFTKDGRL